MMRMEQEDEAHDEKWHHKKALSWYLESRFAAAKEIYVGELDDEGKLVGFAQSPVEWFAEEAKVRCLFRFTSPVPRTSFHADAMPYWVALFSQCGCGWLVVVVTVRSCGPDGQYAYMFLPRGPGGQCAVLRSQCGPL